jgi:putative transposase
VNFVTRYSNAALFCVAQVSKPAVSRASQPAVNFLLATLDQFRNRQAMQARGLDRVRHQLRSTGVKEGGAAPLRSGIHTRGYLPHVKREGASYFITFRLADSLPKEALIKLNLDRAERLQNFQQRPAAQKLEEIERDFRRELERLLDRGVGACHLRCPEIAALTADTLRHFHESRYLLSEWVIMPNHVHAIVWPFPNFLLSDILKSWKQYVSRRARKILKLGGDHFWQPESYDHWIRNSAERARIARYIRNNPVKAGLCAHPEDWPWSSAYHPKP